MQATPSQESGLRRDAFNLMSALDAYDLAGTVLVERWFDMDVYTDFSKKIDAIRDHGVSVPTLTVLSLELVIAHSELVSTLWQNASVGVPAPKLYEVQARHTAAINMLRAAAAKLLRND